MNTKKVYQLDANGYLMGFEIAYESPLEQGVFHLPAGCVDIAPPKKVPEGKIARFVAGKWLIEDIPSENEDDVNPNDTPQQKAIKLIQQAQTRVSPSYIWDSMTKLQRQEFHEWVEYLKLIADNPDYDGEVLTKPYYDISDEELTPEQFALRQTKRLSNNAHDLIERTNRFETSSFQVKYWTEEQEAAFEQWRHKLFDVVYEGANEMPEIPDFVQQALDGNMQPPLLQSALVPETMPKKRKTKSKTTEQSL